MLLKLKKFEIYLVHSLQISSYLSGKTIGMGRNFFLVIEAAAKSAVAAAARPFFFMILLMMSRLLLLDAYTGDQREARTHKTTIVHKL